MNFITPTRQQLFRAIEELPLESLAELANFIEYLQFKASKTTDMKKDETEGRKFLMSIAGLGKCDETDLSERDEEILKAEIGSMRGFSNR